MWLILPIGHDQGIRHFPWVTAGIATLCLLVQLHRSINAPSDDELAAAMREQGRRELALLIPHVKNQLPRRGVGSDPVDLAQNPERVPNLPPGARASKLATRPRDLMAEAQRWQQQQAAQLAALRAGKLQVEDGSAYRAWLEAKVHVERLLRKDIVHRLAYRPSEPISAGLVLSAFAHGGWLHLIGNLLFLYLVGCNLEDRWGRGVFTGLYLGGAVVSALSFWLWHRGAETMLVGASGAVAAAMGAFLVCFHRAKINFLFWSPFRAAHTSEVYAFWVFPLWFAEQLLNSWLEAHLNVGTAYSAHVGGFAFGVALALVLKWSGIERRHLLPATAEGTAWKEDPEYLRALEQLAGRDLVGARVTLEGVIARLPRHAGALEQLARTAMALGDSALAGRALSAYMDELGRTRPAELLPVAHELRLLEEGIPLSDRATAALFRAAAQANQPELMIQAANRLLQQHPQSPLGPGVMWEVARMQEKQNRAHLARVTLEQLIARYPADPFAEQARRKLESM